MANNGSAVSFMCSCFTDLTFSFLFLLFFSLALSLGGMRWHRDEIQRIKAGNPDISHREAFSAAAKNVSDLPLSIFLVISLFLGFPDLSKSHDTAPCAALSEPLFGVVVLLLLQWAHFPHIHFGLMPDHHGFKKTNPLPQVINWSNPVDTMIRYYMKNNTSMTSNDFICAPWSQGFAIKINSFSNTPNTFPPHKKWMSICHTLAKHQDFQTLTCLCLS
jgi:hypothetical protein